MSFQLRLEYITLIIPAFILWCALIYRWRYWIHSYFGSHLAFLSRSLRFSPIIGLMAIPIVWLGATHHFEFDEARTFMSFSSRSLIRAIAFYPSPNNHVLHSILSNITWHLLGWTRSELSVRLTAILFSLMTAAFVSHVFLKGNRLLTLLFITTLFLSNSFFSLSFQARSYSMQSFFAVVGLSAVMGMSDTAPSRRLATLVLSCILGTYSSPAFLYTVFPLLAMFLVRHLNWVASHKKQAVSTVLAGIASVILLYSPILLVESVKAVTSNKYVQPYVYFMIPDFKQHCSGVLRWVVLPGAAGFLFLALTLAHALARKYFYWFLAVLCPVLMMVVLRQMPDARVFQPVGVIILLLGFISLAERIGTIPFKPWVTALSLAVLAATAVYRTLTANEIRNLTGAHTYRRIEKHLPRESAVYMLEVQWLYNDLLLAFAKVKGRKYVQLPDTTSCLPARGMLVTSRRLPNLTCADSILNKTYAKTGALYVYELQPPTR
ncbi:MAG: hypothetical protein EBZ67_03680 [Chitinophagia bacterium]|nr:hypothetical protein [Chitinophagia bacterium]